MGIPSFFQNIVRKNPSKCFPNPNNVKIDYICLDFNCCIHGCVRKVDKKYWSLPSKMLEQKIIQEVVKYVNYLLGFVKPKKGICIFVDGLVPVAKMRQQRDRRFKKIIEKQQIRELYEKHNEPYDEIPFDTNAITPGTLFMKTLCSAVRSEISKNNRHLQFVFSGDDEKGEGEHKCFHWIQTHLANEKSSISVYGLDADLIMLSLLHLDQNASNHSLYLLREKVHFGKVVYNLETHMEELLYFNVNAFRKFTTSYYKTSIPEYVCLCSLMGNDFIPHHPGLEISSDGIELLIDIYNEIKNKYRLSIVDECAEINWYCLLKIMETLSKSYEYNLLLEKENKMSNKRRKIIHYTHDTEFQKEKFLYEHSGLFETPTFTIKNNPCWNNDYYEFLFEEQDRDIIVKHYLQSLFWANSYYHKKSVSYSFYYIHDYAPLFCDIRDYLLTHMSNLNERIECELLRDGSDISYLNTTIQRILVLPPESHFLIHEYTPNQLRELYYMYGVPKRYQYMFREMNWMKTPILPPLLLDDVVGFVSK